MNKPRFTVERTDGALRAGAIEGLDTQRLPYAVWDNDDTSPWGFGEFVCACASAEVAETVSVALERLGVLTYADKLGGEG